MRVKEDTKTKEDRKIETIGSHRMYERRTKKAETIKETETFYSKIKCSSSYQTITKKRSINRKTLKQREILPGLQSSMVQVVSIVNKIHPSNSWPVCDKMVTNTFSHDGYFNSQPNLNLSLVYELI